jgi:NAD(P)-dependent dehydrogenase (short-subunit alcohol dehydrogenase family)
MLLFCKTDSFLRGISQAVCYALDDGQVTIEINAYASVANDMATRCKESEMPMGHEMESGETPLDLDSPVRKKVAIVTGASSGIGRGIAERLYETGYCVIANSRNITSAKTLQPGERLKLVDGNIGSQNTAKQLIDTAILNFGRIDLLVNNAGVFIPKPFIEYTTEDIRRATGTNLLGFLYISQLAVSQMLLQKSGHIVNITSSIIEQPVAGCAASFVNLTKGGLESVTGALAIEFAREGIRFNAISPGVVNTPMHKPEAHEFLKQLSPLNRLAEVPEVVDVLQFLESAPFVNGEVIHLDGGAHAGRW